MIRYIFEVIKKDKTFKSYLKDKLGSKYDDFWEILRFMRHVLVHSKNPDYSDVVNCASIFLGEMRDNGKLQLSFKVLITKDPKYEVDIMFSLQDLEEKKLFGEIIPVYQIYMLLEMLMNLAKEFYDTIEVSNNN